MSGFNIAGAHKKNKMKKLTYLVITQIILIAQLVLGGAVWAQQAFVVKNIEIEGLHRISSSTVKNYLPIKSGQVLKPGQTASVLRAVYQTGFFEQASLSREGNTLVIHVVERPTIGQLKISGNSVIPTDKLTAVMRSVDIAEGRVYNAATLEKIKQSLLGQYYQLGRYNARVDVRVTPMPRNRVLVLIDISEGLIAKVKGISIIGNHVFDESTLISQMDLKTSGYLTFITQADRYSEEKLDASVDKIRSYYMDRGYLRFEVKSAQAQVTPDRKSVFITIVISEGERYTIDKVEVSGNMIMPREELMKYVKVKPGDTFSRKNILDSQKALSNAYGNKGYLFAAVSVQPQINDAAHQVSIVFDIKSGKRAYIRHVTFSDNMRTNDIVLRREIQQLEAAPASTSRLEESKRRLLLLPYIKEAQLSINPVPGVEDQIDVNYKVKEENSAQASVKLGYSQAYRLILGAGINQSNFLGTGNTLGINFSRSRYEQFYGMDYTNPYYTEDGISRSLSMSVSRIDPKGGGVDSGYTSNSYNIGVLYGIPIGQETHAISRLLAGVSYQNLLIHLMKQSKVSNQIQAFVDAHGRHSQFADFKLGISRDSRDRAIFPTRGTYQSLFLDMFAPLDSETVSFYTFNYAGKLYQPIWNDFIFYGKANLGYGNGFHGTHDFPFFKNYYAGGIDSVRGYLTYSLGPKDSRGNAFGGNILADASLNLIFPNYISDNLRTSVFLDGGNVYSSLNNRTFGGNSTNAGPLRYSTGVEADWLTPFGPIAISIAKPLNLHKGDLQEIFQFSLGANF